MPKTSRIENRLRDRLDYWRKKDLKNGWETLGPCCDKCRMINPKDPLQALCGCKDPFQMHCDCHIQQRASVRRHMIWAIEEALGDEQTINP